MTIAPKTTQCCGQLLHFWDRFYVCRSASMIDAGRNSRIAAGSWPAAARNSQRVRCVAGPIEKSSQARTWRCVAIISAAALAGCTHYQAQPLKPEHSAEEFAARELDPVRQWNRAELLAVALKQNPELAVARAEINVALSREIIAAQGPNPGMTLQSEYARHDVHPWLYGVSFDWILRSGEDAAWTWQLRSSTPATRACC